MPECQIYAKYDPIKVEFIPWISSKELLTLILKEKTENPGTLREDDLKIIDARSQEQYDGLLRRSKHGGRIPGAINIPRKVGILFLFLLFLNIALL